MGRRVFRGSRAFYQEQLELIEARLENYFDNSSAKMTREQYFMMCEQLGSEPITSEIPTDFSDFPFVVQQAIQIFSIIPSIWEGMSGTYMGKDYSILPYLFNEIYEVENKQLMMKFILMIENIVREQYAQQQKARQRKAKTSKGGTHVNG